MVRFLLLFSVAHANLTLQQTQNRLTTVKHNQESHRNQLNELRAVLETEKAARPDSVCFFTCGLF